MSYFRYSDRQVYYEESGEDIPLILLHGNTSCGKMFDPIVPALAGKYRVIVPDFLGNGRKIIFDSGYDKHGTYEVFDLYKNDKNEKVRFLFKGDELILANHRSYGSKALFVDNENRMFIRRFYSA